MVITKEICKELTDQEIIKRSLENIDYFACVYGRYETRLLRYIMKISQANSDEANDILQDSFIKVWRNLNEYDDNLKLSSWLYRIVHNETVSFCRKKKSYGKDNKVSIDETSLGMYSDEINEIDEDEKYLLTHSLLDSLPLKYKEVLVLKFLEKMNYEEISDVLRIPEGTVATRINRAKKLFKQTALKENISFKQ